MKIVLKLYSYENKVYILDGVKMWVYDGNTITEVECSKPEFPKEGE